MKKKFNLCEELVEQFDSREMVTLAGGGKVLDAIIEALDKLLNGGHNCHDCMCNYECNVH